MDNLAKAYELIWCARKELNPQPSGPKPDALSN